MKIEFNSYTYLYFFNTRVEELIEKVKNKIPESLKENTRRVQQKVLCLIYSDILSKVSMLGMLQSLEIFNKDELVSINGKFKLNLFTGNFVISLHYRFLLYIKSAFYISICFFELCKGFVKGKLSEKDKINIVLDDLGFEQFYNKNTIIEFNENIKCGYYPVLTPEIYTILKSKTFAGLKVNNVYFFKQPLLSVLSIVKWKLIELFFFMGVLLFSFLKELLLSFNNQYRLLLFDDKLMEVVVSMLARKNIIKNLIITNSSYCEQGTYFDKNRFKNFTTVMLWYSVNSKWFKYKKELGFPNETFTPLFKFMQLDEHYVWNNDQKDWIKKINSDANIRMFGPILFDNPKQKITSGLIESKSFNLVIFDVAPLKDDAARNIYAHSFRFYNLNACLSIIQDPITWSKGKKVKIYIKIKRQYSSHHHSEYIQFIEKCIKLGYLVNIDFSVSISSVLKEKVDLLICSPFTSVSVLGNFLQKKSIYYDPTKVLECHYGLGNYQKFISGRENLISYLDTLYEKSIKKV
ncbi:polysaccharide biosynthesis PFTS motif protein [Leptospira interrogans]|uniref:Polysaccharide biosynthesis PFTS motif protein n=1 Tax=Leptospira interrogans serovar Autumnalis TaxID=174157 RepID=D4HSS2_LEPIR|nr:polysaccharide biosynthesis PFTS motif protein [Leptospira interrogans]ADC93955.1 hypothetical protein [Leptospira interrogans serovar Autumnalis]QCO33566.1 polysaccharide biosynthesis PFTS motif protein [Leptospira interrogans]QCO37055.1 polysaccharide biosynthesis PFTS motif protein [Leptospira interrogans]UMQ55707.1 polysaccharide biosynthesis PFTS motif protein [Leptospira interrogans]